MDFSLNDRQQKVVDICAELSKDFATRAGQHDRDRSAPNENYEKLREAGMYGMAIPAEYGGPGIGFTGLFCSHDRTRTGMCLYCKLI